MVAKGRALPRVLGAFLGVHRAMVAGAEACWEGGGVRGAYGHSPICPAGTTNSGIAGLRRFWVLRLRCAALRTTVQEESLARRPQ